MPPQDSLPPRRRLLPAFLIGSLIVAVLVTAVLLATSWKRIEAVFAIPEDARHGFFIVLHPNGTAVYDWKGLLMDRSLEKTWGVLSYAHAGKVSASIASVDRHTFTVRSGSTDLYTSPLPKTHVSISPNGNLIAYAEAPPEDATSTADTVAPSVPGWNIYLIDASTKEPQLLGVGVAPSFLSDTQLVWFTSDGLVTYDLVSRQNRIMDAGIKAASIPSPVQSPDRSIIAWADAASGNILVSRIAPEGAQPIAQYQATLGSMPTLALTDTSIYLLNSRTDSPSGVTPVRQYSLESPQNAPLEFQLLFGLTTFLVP
ncbi:MAG: hypothetical protein AAB582_03995 [Patescibacteria group bacterium]